MTLDDAKTIARSWAASAGQSREAARTLLVELERCEEAAARVVVDRALYRRKVIRLEEQLERVRRDGTAAASTSHVPRPA